MGQKRFTKLTVGGAGCFLFFLVSPAASALWSADEQSAQGGRTSLPDTETAVVMRQPALPLRLAEDCPSTDRCEFGTNWRVCEPVPVYRQPRAGAPLVRNLKANEKFRAEGGEIELIAPGEVTIVSAPDAAQTGGLALPQGSMLLVYGPMATSRALYFDSVSGKGWSPGAASDQFWGDPKVAKLSRVPEMTWWVKARLTDGKTGWLRLDYVPDAQNFPSYDYAEAIQSWNVDIERDDESPDCDGLLEMRAS
jgi:hypothetical protein